MSGDQLFYSGQQLKQAAPYQLQGSSAPAKGPSISCGLSDLEQVILGRLISIQVELSRIADRLVGSAPIVAENKKPQPVDVTSLVERLYRMRGTLVDIADSLESSMHLIENGL